MRAGAAYTTGWERRSGRRRSTGLAGRGAAQPGQQVVNDAMQHKISSWRHRLHKNMRNR